MLVIREYNRKTNSDTDLQRTIQLKHIGQEDLHTWLLYRKTNSDTDLQDYSAQTYRTGRSTYMVVI